MLCSMLTICFAEVSAWCTCGRQLSAGSGCSADNVHWAPLNTAWLLHLKADSLLVPRALATLGLACLEQ